MIVLLPIISGIFPPGVGVEQILLVFVAMPLALNATFTTGIVTGRQAVRWYAGINMVYPVVSTVLLVILLGGLNGSLNGAIAVYLIAASIQSFGFAIGARMVSGHNPEPSRSRIRELLRYGLPFYPSSLTQFFSARADVFLIAWLVPDSSAPLGYYSMAVGLAELVFFSRTQWRPSSSRTWPEQHVRKPTARSRWSPASRSSSRPRWPSPWHRPRW